MEGERSSETQSPPIETGEVKALCNVASTVIFAATLRERLFRSLHRSKGAHGVKVPPRKLSSFFLGSQLKTDRGFFTGKVSLRSFS